MTQKTNAEVAREILKSNCVDYERYPDVLDSITKALAAKEDEVFERTKSEIAKICLSPAILPNFNCFDGVCVAKAIADLNIEAIRNRNGN